MVTASLQGPSGTFSMEVSDAGYDPAKSPTPTTTMGRKSGLVLVEIYGRAGEAGQDSAAHSLEFTIEGLALAADRDKIDSLVKDVQIGEDGAGVNTLIVRGVTQAHIGLLSWTSTDVEGSALFWRYSIRMAVVEAPPT